MIKTNHRGLCFQSSVGVSLCAGMESVTLCPVLSALIAESVGLQKGLQKVTEPLRGCLSSWDLFLSEKLEGWNALGLICFQL